jgi:hypothetical protein
MQISLSFLIIFVVTCLTLYSYMHLLGLILQLLQCSLSSFHLTIWSIQTNFYAISAHNNLEFVTEASTRVICKVRGLTSLLQFGTMWRCGDGLFFEVPPLASDVLLTTLHTFLENVLQTVHYFEISCLRAPFSWLEKPINRMERDLN